MPADQRNTGSAPRIKEDPDQPVGAGPAPAAAAKGASVGILISALVGAVLVAPLGLLEILDLPTAARVLICAAVGAVAFAVIGGLVGGWVGLGAAAKRRENGS